MIASSSTPSKLEGVAAAGGRGRVSTEFHVGANHYSPLQSIRIPPIGTVGANHHSPPQPAFGRANRSPVGATDFSRGHKPTGRVVWHEAEPHRGDGSTMTNIRRPYGAPRVLLLHRGLTPTAKICRPYGAPRVLLLHRGLAPTAKIRRPYGAPRVLLLHRGLAPTAKIRRPYGAPFWCCIPTVGANPRLLSFVPGGDSPAPPLS